MFGLGSHRKRKEILLSCPACGREQREPALAISTYCRSCGIHYRIEDGQAVLPPGAMVSGISVLSIEEPEEEIVPARPKPEETKPQPALGAEARSLASEDEPRRGVGETWMGKQEDDDETRSSTTTRRSGANRSRKKGGRKKKGKPGRNPEKSAKSNPDANGDSSRSIAPSGAGSSREAEDDDGDLHLGEKAQPKEVLREGSMSAMLGNAVGKLSEEATEKRDEEFRPRMPRGFKPAPHVLKGGTLSREIRCFECNHKQMVSIAATSTQCARCSVYISLVNHEITTPWSQNIRTRGNVHVRKRGAVTGCDVACHDLEVDGRLSATVDCSGIAVFRQSARIMGHMHCKHLVVEKKCETIFPQGVWAESVEVFGTVVGDITCAGTIRIYKHGRVEGDATARAVDLKDGGELSGRMSIQSDLDITPREKDGYLRTF